MKTERRWNKNEIRSAHKMNGKEIEKTATTTAERSVKMNRTRTNGITNEEWRTQTQKKRRKRKKEKKNEFRFYEQNRIYIAKCATAASEKWIQREKKKWRVCRELEMEKFFIWNRIFGAAIVPPEWDGWTRTAHTHTHRHSAHAHTAKQAIGSGAQKKNFQIFRLLLIFIWFMYFTAIFFLSSFCARRKLGVSVHPALTSKVKNERRAYAEIHFFFLLSE